MGCPHRLVASLVRAACNPGMASGRAPAGAPRGAQGPRAKEAPALSALEFIGCEAVAMSPEALRRYEGRLEVWDAELATAWMVREPTSPAHERPSQGLAGLVERIGAVHHAPARLECTGVRAPASGNLLRRGMVLPGPATGPRGVEEVFPVSQRLRHLSAPLYPRPPGALGQVFGSGLGHRHSC